MRTISCKLEDLKNMTLHIGYEGENDYTSVRVDAGSVFAQYPDAVPSMKVQPPKGNMYPVIVTRDGDIVIWNVSDSDTASNGNGEIQLTFTENTVVVKSCTGKTLVHRSLKVTGPAPDPLIDFIDRAEEVVGEAAEAAEKANDAAEHAPMIGLDGYWYKWDAEAEEYTKTETKARGENGTDGVGIASVQKISTSGLVDTYQINFTNGTTTTYEVTNGQDGTVPIDDTNPAANKVFSSAKVDQEITSVKNHIDGISESVEAVNDFFETNDLDANAEGKVNVLNTPYDISDIATGKLISKNGSISDYDRSCVSPLIPISQGTYGLKVKKDNSTNAGTINWGQDYKNGYGFFDSDGTTVISRPSTLLHSVGTDIYVFDVPADAKYLRLSYYVPSNWQYSDVLPYFNQWILLPGADDNIDDTFFNLQGKKENGEIDKLERNDGSYLAIKDATARSALFGRRTCAIFEKVCGIGDSYMHGYIMNTSGTSHNEPNYSWVKHLESLTGREYLNLGITGARSDTWLTNPDGLAKMQLPANKSQAYIIGLQINDVAAQLTVGTVSDIGTETTSYYGCISKIIDEIFDVNDDAHVFLLTQPKTNEYIAPYRTAILNIVEWYQDANNGTHQSQVHLIDLLEYSDLFNYAGCNDSIVSHHYTAVGYEFIAEIMSYAWSQYINAHPLLFQDVNLIPYGSAT